MRHPRELKIEDYTYELPDDRIAKYPLAERDSSKLLVYRKDTLQEDSYSNIATHIPVDSLVVFNQTKVVHARLLFQKATGSTIEVFCLEPHQDYGDVQTAMLQKNKVWWQCMVGGASKWKQGMILTLVGEGFTLSATIVDRGKGIFTLEFTWDNNLSFAEILHQAGKVPLPPYLHRNAEESDEERYQTIYAKHEGSVAAPTAGLHFTDGVMASLASKNIATEFVTLHVGAGTFKPVKSETMKEHDMHAEWIDVTTDTIEHLIANLETSIVAVGTTSMRTLESLYWIGAKLYNGTPIDFAQIAVTQWDPYEIPNLPSATDALNTLLSHLNKSGQNRLLTRTQILIAPSYTPKVVKGLVTNFHQPQSTLLLLVSSIIGDDWKRLYNHAMKHDFRFLSYGDGCLLWCT